MASCNRPCFVLIAGYWIWIAWPMHRAVGRSSVMSSEVGSCMVFEVFPDFQSVSSEDSVRAVAAWARQ